MACRFDLSDGAVHVQATGRIPFWSVSVYNRRGQNIYSLNDRAQTLGDLDLVLVTPAQMLELKKNVPKEFEKSVFVEADVGRGIVAVRGFVLSQPAAQIDASADSNAATIAALTGLRCLATLGHLASPTMAAPLLDVAALVEG